MADGQEIRAEIDTETVRNLVLINGGMAGALATILSSTLKDARLEPLSIGMVIGIGVSCLGLIFATVHNRCRRKWIASLMVV